MDFKNKYIVDEKTNCWNWMGSKKGSGYGYLTVGSRTDGTRKTDTAHRYSYRIHIGQIPQGLWVLHKCDNPSCVNPEHLYAGDRMQNVKDMILRGRRASDKGESNNNSKLTAAQVLEIRKERDELKTPYRKLAYKFGLRSHKTIIEICNRKLWPHILPEPPK